MAFTMTANSLITIEFDRIHYKIPFLQGLPVKMVPPNLKIYLVDANFYTVSAKSCITPNPAFTKYLNEITNNEIKGTKGVTSLNVKHSVLFKRSFGKNAFRKAKKFKVPTF